MPPRGPYVPREVQKPLMSPRASHVHRRPPCSQEVLGTPQLPRMAQEPPHSLPEALVVTQLSAPLVDSQLPGLRPHLEPLDLEAALGGVCHSCLPTLPLVLCQGLCWRAVLFLCLLQPQELLGSLSQGSTAPPPGQETPVSSRRCMYTTEDHCKKQECSIYSRSPMYTSGDEYGPNLHPSISSAAAAGVSCVLCAPVISVH